jgi:hypothetical protein
MIRPLLLTCILTLSLVAGYGQISFGPKAGINLANWTTEGHNTITAFQGGAVVHFPIGENFSVQAELLYEGKGTDLSDFIPNNPMRFSMKYLTLEAMLGYKIRGITLLLGPYVSYLLEYKLEINQKEVQFPDGATPFEPWDWGLATGASFEVTPGFGFEVLYYFGFPDVVDITFGDQNGNFIARLDEGKNRVLQLGAYYRFNSED